MRKAFDMVIMVLDGLRWISLIGMCQYVKINNNITPQEKLAMGVPYGTKLGPLLFILYIREVLFILPDESLRYCCNAKTNGCK